MIERNRHPAGRCGNALFGLAEIIDGLIRVISLGHLHTRLVLNCSRWQARRLIERYKGQHR